MDTPKSSSDWYAPNPDEEQVRLQMRAESEEKYQKWLNGGYSCAMDAFSDGCPLDMYDLDPEEGQPKPRAKSLKRIKMEERFRALGKEPPPIKPPKMHFLEEDDFYSDENGVKYLKHYLRQIKPPKCIHQNCRIVYVGSARDITVRIQEHQDFFGEFLDPQIQEIHSDDAHSMPDALIVPGNACAFKDEFEDVWKRGLILDFFVEEYPAEVPVRLVDFGNVVMAPRSELKALQAGRWIVMEPALFRAKIKKLCEPKPSDEFTNLVKELLDRFPTMIAQFESPKNSKEPFRVLLRYMNDAGERADFNELFYKEYETRLPGRRKFWIEPPSDVNNYPNRSQQQQRNVASRYNNYGRTFTNSNMQRDFRFLPALSEEESSTTPPSESRASVKDLGIDEIESSVATSDVDDERTDTEPDVVVVTDSDTIFVVEKQEDEQDEETDDEKDDRCSVVSMDMSSKWKIAQWIENTKTSTEFCGSTLPGCSSSSTAYNVYAAKPPLTKRKVYGKVVGSGPP